MITAAAWEVMVREAWPLWEDGLFNTLRGPDDPRNLSGTRVASSDNKQGNATE